MVPRLFAGFSAALAVVAGTSLLAAASPFGPDARSLAGRFFGPQLARAEIVVARSGAVRGFRVDRGTVRSASPGLVEVRELDGTVVSIPVAPDARVRVNGRRGTVAHVRRGARVTVIRTINGFASEISVGPPSRREAVALGRQFFGPRFARAEVVLVSQGGPVGYRIDHGHVRSVGTAALELREADGTVVTVPLAATASVRVNGRRGALGEVRRGATATTVRQVGQPATELYVVSRR